MFIDPDLKEEGQDPALYRMLVDIVSISDATNVKIIDSVSL